MKRSFLIILTAAVSWAQNAGAEGDWRGTLNTPSGTYTLLLRVTQAQDGLYLGTLTSSGQGVFAIDRVVVAGESVRWEVPTVTGRFEGTLNAERTQMKGSWSIATTSLPLELTRMGAPARPAQPPADWLPNMARAIGVPMDIETPVAPIAFTGHDGRTSLVYELHLTNLAPVELHVSRIEVLNGNATLITYEGVGLNGALQRFGVDVLDKRAIGPGLRAVAFVWVGLTDGAAVPGTLRNRVTVDGYSVESTVTVSAARPVVLGPPLRGPDWQAGNGPSNTSIHRRALQPIEGRLHLAQRYAIDWFKQGADGRTFTGDQKENKNYHAYGNEALAVADASVVETKDGIRENVPGATSRAVPMTIETIGGNYAILDLGGGRFAFYAHLQPGSLKVKVGDKVRRGQVLGLVGNSGNSTEPHLHFHVSDARSFLGSEGVPYLLESFEVIGAVAPGQKTNALPLEGARVKFPESR